LLADDENEYMPHVSGSATYREPQGPGVVKMIMSLPPYEDLDTFAEHHGWDNTKYHTTHSQHQQLATVGGNEACACCRVFLNMAAMGRDTELRIAREILPPSQHPR
jgi:hypothetical protein